MAIPPTLVHGGNDFICASQQSPPGRKKKPQCYYPYFMDGEIEVWRGKLLASGHLLQRFTDLYVAI